MWKSRPVQILGGSRRALRILGVGILLIAVVFGIGSLSPTTAADSTADPAASASPSASTSAAADDDESSTLPKTIEPQVKASATPPYGQAYPVTVETNFSRPVRAMSTSANSDFSQLNDLERLIRGSYRSQITGKILPSSSRKAHWVYLTISRMEDSRRVGRELIKAAKYGVNVRVIHGKFAQSTESRALAKSLKKYKNARFKICAKGRSSACLSNISGAVVHSKILMVSNTYDRNSKPTRGAIWTGSANLGGPSAEHTWNNGWTVYNDLKLWNQFSDHWKDLWAERNVKNNYLSYIKAHASATRYGIATSTAQKAGYTARSARYGMFYSNLANVTYYLTPIFATPANGRDPVMQMLNRVIPDDRCRIYVQHNRFKYRRIGVAEKLVELANKGCRVEAIAYRDELKINRIAHCQQYLRICKPIMDELRTANVRIPLAWAKPHDKTMLIDARLKPNKYNPEERLPTGGTWPSGGARVRIVQAGSAALTGSNLVVSDEITTESTDPDVFEQYLQHWKAINKSYEFHQVAY